jgi:SAM-dependent methyltransferase
MAKILDEHFGYLSDQVKVEQYRTALDQLVRPEHSVLDLGCGAGLLGLMALRAGARKVIFVEEGEIIEVARRTVAEAGFGDRAEFFQTNSFELALSEPVDVVVCDHVGYFGFDYGILGLLSDARQRFLKPGGIVLPSEIELQLTLIESESCRRLVGQWRDGNIPEDFCWVGASAANTKHAAQLEPQDLLAESVFLATLDLGDEAPPFLSWSVEITCARDGTLDGVAGWFDCQLADGIRMTNSPTATKILDRPQAFLPLETPQTVSAGERIKITIMARHVDNVIGWVIELPDAGTRFSHTTFNGLLLDSDALTRSRQNRAASLNDRGRARQVVLSYCDGERSLEDVETLVRRNHPDLFPSAIATSSFIRQVLQWDTGE